MSNYPNCIDCPNHKIIADPDPYDWFCDDDVAVICLLTSRNHRHDPNSRYQATSQNDNSCATVSCRPYNVSKETTPPPLWCPLLKKE